MAVLPMQRISIYALKKNRKAILELMQRRGVVEVKKTDLEDTVFHRMDTSSAQSLFEKNKSAASQALEILDHHAPEKKGLLSMLDGRKEIPLESYQSDAQRIEDIMKKALYINSLQKEIAEDEAEALRLENQLEALNPWMALDITMRLKGTRTTAAFIGTVSGQRSEEDLLLTIADQAPELSGIHVEVISSDKQQTCLFALCRKESAQELENVLRGLGFARPATPSKTPPAQRKAELARRINDAYRRVAGREEEIKSLADCRKDFQFAVDYYAMRVEKYQVISDLAQSRHTFIVTGYIPERDAPSLEQELNGLFSVAVELEDPQEDEDVPVLLKNSRFAAPVEPVLESYSLPKRGEVDPSSVMAVFYYVFFGLMLSDAAYGLVMVIACGLVLHRKKSMEPGLRKSIQMFYYCGFTTIFWGVMFGSYFGDAVDVIASTFFHTELTIPPVWFIPVQEPMRLLAFSFLLGVVHLFVGLGMQLYQLCKARKYKDAVYDVIFWYLLVGGGIVFLLSMDMMKDMLGLGFVLPSTVGNIAAVCAGVGALGIIFTAGRDSRSPVKRLFKGLYGLYNISGYLSDILSYSRLLALGLATGVIASVFNQMGSMAGGGVVGAIVFTLVFVVGHTLNIAINLLGAYVHTNRLQYVEFFGKFYEGGGRKFNQFSVKTNYYKIREDH